MTAAKKHNIYTIGKTQGVKVELAQDTVEEYKCNDPLAAFCEVFIQADGDSSKYDEIIATSGLAWVLRNAANASPEALNMAGGIREYYHTRVMEQRLTHDREPSQFKLDLLLGFQAVGKVPHKCIGPLYRIPFFYAEDTLWDQLLEDPQTQPLPEWESLARTLRDDYRWPLVFKDCEVVARIQVLRRTQNQVPHQLIIRSGDGYLFVHDAHVSGAGQHQMLANISKFNLAISWMPQPRTRTWGTAGFRYLHISKQLDITDISPDGKVWYNLRKDS